MQRLLSKSPPLLRLHLPISCAMQVAVDFVSPQSVGECLAMAERLRNCPKPAVFPEDVLNRPYVEKLQAANIMIWGAIQAHHVLTRTADATSKAVSPLGKVCEKRRRGALPGGRVAKRTIEKKATGKQPNGKVADPGKLAKTQARSIQVKPSNGSTAVSAHKDPPKRSMGSTSTDGDQPPDKPRNRSRLTDPTAHISADKPHASDPHAANSNSVPAAVLKQRLDVMGRQQPGNPPRSPFQCQILAGASKAGIHIQGT